MLCQCIERKQRKSASSSTHAHTLTRSDDDDKRNDGKRQAPPAHSLADVHARARPPSQSRSIEQETTQQQSTMSTTRRCRSVFVLLQLLAVALPAAVVLAQGSAPAPTPQVTPTDGCCAACIGKTTDLPYTYDPVIHSQCSAARGVCCYNCGQDAAAQMTVVNGAFGADGVTPQVKAGEWAQVQWPNVARVTYETYQATQKKVTTVRNGSLEARVSGGSFWICAKTQGSSIYARGWGADACKSATKENKIEVRGDDR